MKKIKNNLNKFLKLFLALSLLFNNLMPLSVVFADEVNDDKQSVNDIINDNANNNNQNNNNQNNDNQNNDNQNNEKTNNDDLEVKNAFTVTIEENNIIIKYTDVDNLTDESIKINEDFEYLDNTTYGGLYTEITLDDEIKESLKEGYAVDSDILNENIFDGTYTVSVSIGTESVNESLEVTNEESGFSYEVYTNDGTLIEKNEEDKYIVDTDTEGLNVKVKVLMGGISPSDKFTFNDEEIELSDLLEGMDVLAIELNGNLYGEFDVNVFSDLYKGADKQEPYEEMLTIVYGTYEENTNLLNESAKNVDLDAKYIFYGDTKDGVIYSLTEVNKDEISTIVKNMIGENDKIEYIIDETDNKIVLTLTDSLGIVVTYSTVILSEDTKITSSLTTEAESITSGDEFRVNYLVKVKDYAINGINGLINYDKELLELVSAKSELFTGINEENLFLYLGDSIHGTLVYDDEENSSIEEEEYVVLTLTFEALKAGTSEIKIEDAKFYNYDVYYQGDEDLKLEIIVDSSSDNTLSKLIIAGYEIPLEDDVLEYELNVPNDVTEALVEATLTNKAATIESIVCPEELVEGENIITILVKAENGDLLEYAIKLSREEAVKEEATPTYVSQTYQDTTETIEEDKKEEIVKEKDDDEEQEDIKDKKENKTTRMIVIALISLAVLGLIYLIFRDDSLTNEPSKSSNKPNTNKSKEIIGNKEKNNGKSNNHQKENKKER